MLDNMAKRSFRRTLTGEDEMQEAVLMAGDGEDEEDSPPAPLALVDTACTRCMHSRRWREEFEKKCLKPWGLKVEILDGVRQFTSAFGDK